MNKFSIIISLMLLFLPFSSRAGTNVDIIFGPGFPISETNILPGDEFTRTFSVENKTTKDQELLLKLERTSVSDPSPLEERIYVSLTRVSDDLTLTLPALTLEGLYSYVNPDTDYENAFYFDDLPGGVGNSEEYQLDFFLDPYVGNEYQGTQTVFDFKVGIFSIESEEGVSPTAIDDYFEIEMNDVENLGILINDSPADSAIDPTSIAIISGPSHGNVTINTSGSLAGTVTYDPNHDYEGADFFTYTIKDMDGDVSNVATVVVDIEEDDGSDEDDDGEEGGSEGGTTDILIPSPIPAGTVVNEEGDEEPTAAGEQETAADVDQSAASIGGPEVAGKVSGCFGWPWWVWAIILLVLVGLMISNDRRNLAQKEYGWKFNLFVLGVGILFWFYFDDCVKEKWFLYAIILVAFVVHLFFLYLLRRKIRAEIEDWEGKK